VYITDCKGDCIVIAHQAEQLARSAFTVGVVVAMLVGFALGVLLIVEAFRR
jgi:hypothetical protein